MKTNNNKKKAEEMNFFEDLEEQSQQQAEFELSSLLIAIKSKELNMAKLKAELRKTKIEIQKDILSLKTDKLKNSAIQIEFDNELRRSENNISKIDPLVFALCLTVVDSEKTILGSEPYLKPILENENREIVLNKLMNLIQSL